MTEKEIVTCIRTLKAYYPYYYKGITKEEAEAVIEVWKTQFSNFEYELVKKGVDKWGGEKATPPSIAELKSTLFRFYDEYCQKYTEMKVDPNANLEELERIDKIRSLAWSCGGIRLK